jgi:hypothetical protein
LCSPITVWNSPLVNSDSGEVASLLRSSDFGRHDDQRLAELAHHLAAQQVEDLAGRGRLHDLHVVVGASCMKRSRRAELCSGPWPS